MVSFLLLGPQTIRSEVSAIDNGESFRLSMSHPGGTIVEYFKTPGAAMRRQHEIEGLFLGVPHAGGA